MKATLVLSVSMLAALAGTAWAQQINTDYSVDVDITPKHVMQYSGDCSGGGYAGITVHENATVAVADVECPQTFGVTAQGMQIMITTPGPVARSVPVTLALDTRYHLRILVRGGSIFVSIPGVAEINWENAPIKPNPTEWPKSVLYHALAEFNGWTVTLLDQNGQPIPMRPGAQPGAPATPPPPAPAAPPPAAPSYPPPAMPSTAPATPSYTPYPSAPPEPAYIPPPPPPTTPTWQ
ncbi:MAG: hypothetical protein HY897_16650 [Deltaproteobacteria bacterium]|nr:hypothetical protein [Deltaproteobacteria bacterium]